MPSLFWVPLPDGRTWWPAVLIKDREALLKSEKYAKAQEFWQQNKRARFNSDDNNNGDVFVLVFGACWEEFHSSTTANPAGHRFAVVPQTSLRAFDKHLPDFSQGIVSSGKYIGRITKSAAERNHLQQVLTKLQDGFVQASKPAKPPVQQLVPPPPPPPPQQQAPPPPPPPPPLQQQQQPARTTSPPPKFAPLQAPPPPPPPPPPLAIPQFQSNVVVGLSPSTSPPPQQQQQEEEDAEQEALMHRLVQVKRTLAQVQTRIANRAQATAQLIQPSPCAGLTADTLRNWDFCFSFRDDLALFKSDQAAFPSLNSFDACLDNSECFMFAEICTQLVNFISLHSVSTPPAVKINCENGQFAPNLGTTCTRLSWQVLLEQLIKHDLVQLPSNPTSRQCVSALISSCIAMEPMRKALRWRQAEYSTFVKSSPSLFTAMSNNISNLEFFLAEEQVERSNEGEADLAQCLHTMLHNIQSFRLSKRVRNVSFGKDHEGRLLSLLSANEDDCVVWARSNAPGEEQWFLYQSEPVLVSLLQALASKNRRKECAVIRLVLDSYRMRFRPNTVSLYGEARALGWRFTKQSDALVGLDVLKYLPGQGVSVGRVCGYNSKLEVFRIVFRGTEWKSGVDYTRQELEHVLKMNRQPFNAKYWLGDFEFQVGDYQPIAGAGNWIKQDEQNSSNASSLLVMVACPEKKVIALGVIIARSENGAFALVLADGGETVVLTPTASILRAQHQAQQFDPSPFSTQFQRIERFRPLTHHSGEVVGLAGVVNLFRKDHSITSMHELRALLLEFEETYHDSLWQVEDVEQAGAAFGSAWVSFVQRVDSVAAFGFALECLAPFVVRPLSESPTPDQQAKSTSPPEDKVATNEFESMNDELDELEMVLQNQAGDDASMGHVLTPPSSQEEEETASALLLLVQQQPSAATIEEDAAINTRIKINQQEEESMDKADDDCPLQQNAGAPTAEEEGKRDSVGNTVDEGKTEVSAQEIPKQTPLPSSQPELTTADLAAILAAPAKVDFGPTSW